MIKTHHLSENEAQDRTLWNGPMVTGKMLVSSTTFFWWPDQNLAVPFPSRFDMLNEQRDFVYPAPQNELLN